MPKYFQTKIMTSENIIHWVNQYSKIPIVESIGTDTFKEMNFSPFVYENKSLKSITSTWDQNYFNSKIGHIKVDVYVSADGTFPGGHGEFDKNKYRIINITLSECIKRMNRQVNDYFLNVNEKYYIYQVPGNTINELLPDLSQLDSIQVIQSKTKKYFWLSSPGNITPIHYDLSDNFLIQLTGVKKVLCWNPSNYNYLDLIPIGQNHDRQSRINPYNLTSYKKSKLSEIETFKHDLLPGQILYIPLGWCHYVYTETFACSMNYWWRPEFLESTISLLNKTDPFNVITKTFSEEINKNRPELLYLFNAFLKNGTINDVLSQNLI